LKRGLVLKSTGSWYSVKDIATSEVYLCNLRGKMRIDGIKNTNPITVGDYVDFELNENDKKGLISSILPRNNYIIRKATNLSKQTHIIAANLDQAVLMVTVASPETYPLFIDRFLITAEAYQIPAKLIFNKTDLYDAGQKAYMDYLVDIYQQIGYGCYKISVEKKINIDTIEHLLKDKVSVITGISGVGKTSLINSIDPSLDLKISKISDYHKSGKHSTTFAEMFELSFGGYIIDTPGLRGFGLFDIKKDELFHYFPEIFKASKNCRFYNCTHVHEPGCEVVEEVKSGKISELRYQNYISIFTEKETKHRL
jgi:ribosome biogenesis GTPase